MARDFAHDGDIARCEREGGRRRPLETGAMAPSGPRGLGHPISVSRLPGAPGHEQGHRLVHLMPHIKERGASIFSCFFNAIEIRDRHSRGTTLLPVLLILMGSIACLQPLALVGMMLVTYVGTLHCCFSNWLANPDRRGRFQYQFLVWSYCAERCGVRSVGGRRSPRLIKFSRPPYELCSLEFGPLTASTVPETS